MTRVPPLLAAVASAVAVAVIAAAPAVITSEHDIQPHLAVQNTWFTAADVSPYGVRNDVVSISGHWFWQEGTRQSTFEEFLAKSHDDAVARLHTYLQSDGAVDANTDRIVVIDIERPHPKNFHTYSRKDQRAIVKAFKVRIEAARTVFPNARLALYGTLVPDQRGDASSETYKARLRALRYAGQLGLYDDLDYLVPVLYVRFGCDDEMVGPCDRDWGTLAAYTQLAIDGSRQLKRSEGWPVPLLPILGFKVYNGNSLFHRELLANLGVPDPIDATLGRQIDILAANGVHDVVLWTGPDSNQLGGPEDPTVTDYLSALFGGST